MDSGFHWSATGASHVVGLPTLERASFQTAEPSPSCCCAGRRLVDAGPVHVQVHRGGFCASVYAMFDQQRCPRLAWADLEDLGFSLVTMIASTGPSL